MHVCSRVHGLFFLFFVWSSASSALHTTSAQKEIEDLPHKIGLTLVSLFWVCAALLHHWLEEEAKLAAGANYIALRERTYATFLHVS